MRLVQLEPIPVLFVTAAEGLAGISEAWSRLESALPTLRGRRFYGAYLDGEYRACVATVPADDADRHDLARWVIPGGTYVSTKLDGWTERPEAIRETVEMLHDAHVVDVTRPDIEFYRNQREMTVCVPVGEPPTPA